MLQRSLRQSQNSMVCIAHQDAEGSAGGNSESRNPWGGSYWPSRWSRNIPRPQACEHAAGCIDPMVARNISDYMQVMSISFRERKPRRWLWLTSIMSLTLQKYHPLGLGACGLDPGMRVVNRTVNSVEAWEKRSPAVEVSACWQQKLKRVTCRRVEA